MLAYVFVVTCRSVYSEATTGLLLWLLRLRLLGLLHTHRYDFPAFDDLLQVGILGRSYFFLLKKGV